jgi:L-asparaginase II
MDQELKDYLDRKFQLTDARIDALQDELILVKRESRQVEKRVVDFDEARSIFRTETTRINMWTRVAVAAISALAILGNGGSALIGQHYAVKAEQLAMRIARDEIEHAELRNQTRDRELAKAGARELWNEVKSQQGMMVTK